MTDSKTKLYIILIISTVVGLPCLRYLYCKTPLHKDGNCFFKPSEYIDVKKGIFSIILTATILTIFEIGLFYAIIAPQVDYQMNNNLDGIAEKLSNVLLEKKSDAEKWK